MDWEPEIPGQFDTPLRIRRKRTISDTGFLLEATHSDHPSPVKGFQSWISTYTYFVPIVTILATTFRIIRQFISPTIQGANKRHNRSSGGERSRQVVEIRQLNTAGHESVKRRTIDSGITRSVAPASQRIVRNRGRSEPGKSSPTASHRKSTLQMAASAEKSSQQISVSETQSQAAPINREVLGARILASFTPHPLPGTNALQAISEPTVRGGNSPANPGTEYGREYHLTASQSGFDSSVNEEVVSINPNNNNQFQMDRQNDIRRHSEPSRSSLQPLLHKAYASSSSRGSRLPQLALLPHDVEEQFRQSAVSSKASKRVQFKENHTESRRFWRKSKVDEWAPSSPWAADQARDSTLPLEKQLESLEAPKPWSPPPSTPIRTNKIKTFSTNTTYRYNSGDSSAPNVLTSPASADNTVEHTIKQKPKHQQSILHTNRALEIQQSPYRSLKKIWNETLRPIFANFSPNSVAKNNNQNTAHETVPSILGLQPTNEGKESSIISTPKVDDHNVLLGSIVKGGADDSPNMPEDDTYSRPASFKSESSADERLDYSLAIVSAFTSSSKGADVLNMELEQKLEAFSMSELSKQKLNHKRKEREAAKAAMKAAEEKAAEEVAAAIAKAEAAKAGSRRRLPNQKLVQPLSEAWRGKIEEILHKSDDTIITTTVRGSEVRAKDFRTVLGPTRWLNDEIINTYMEWVVEYANEKAGKSGRNAIPKAVAQSSFFYKNIAENGPKSVIKWMKKKRADGKKLLEIEILLIPVCIVNHWTLIVVSPKARTIEYLDSFAGNPKVFIDNTKEWLAIELGPDWHEEEWRVLNTRSSKQHNGYDCGVFTITNAECVVGGVTTDSYGWEDMAAQRRRIAGVLLNRGFGGELIPAEEL